MVFSISESERSRHQIIDDTLEKTREMLTDTSVSTSALAELALTQLNIIDSYLYVPNRSGNRLITPKRYMSCESMGI